MIDLTNNSVLLNAEYRLEYSFTCFAYSQDSRRSKFVLPVVHSTSFVSQLCSLSVWRVLWRMNQTFTWDTIHPVSPYYELESRHKVASQERERETDRETERQTDRQTDRQTEKESVRMFPNDVCHRRRQHRSIHSRFAIGMNVRNCRVSCIYCPQNHGTQTV